MREGQPFASLRTWALVHKWTSLACTVFLLVVCLTGLPLVFREELADLLSNDPPYRNLPADTPMGNLDAMVETARKLHPDLHISYVFVDDDEPRVMIGMLPSMTSPPNTLRRVKLDARTGEVIRDIAPVAQRSLDFLEFVVRLHRNLFLDLPGDLFLGAMGLLFVAAIVSGIALYKPFARKIDFGEVRNKRGARVRWLDLHNLLGVVTLAWGLVVGVTGVVNELTVPLFALWQKTDVKAMIEPYRGHETPTLGELATVQSVFDRTRRELPGMVTTSVAFPGSPFGTPYHYMVWTKGATPLTSRLFSPVLVDARTGALQTVVKMPWYLSALEISRPLHFGDYGGLPLKIIWALLDLVTIAVLGSGVYLWLSRRRSPIEERLAELQAAE